MLKAFSPQQHRVKRIAVAMALLWLLLSASAICLHKQPPISLQTTSLQSHHSQNNHHSQHDMAAMASHDVMTSMDMMAMGDMPCCQTEAPCCADNPSLLQSHDADQNLLLSLMLAVCIALLPFLNWRPVKPQNLPAQVVSPVNGPPLYIRCCSLLH